MPIVRKSIWHWMGFLVQVPNLRPLAPVPKYAADVEAKMIFATQASTDIVHGKDVATLENAVLCIIHVIWLQEHLALDGHFVLQAKPVALCSSPKVRS